MKEQFWVEYGDKKTKPAGGQQVLSLHLEGIG